MPLSTVGKIGFIGGGNMAEAFIKGLISGGFLAKDILFSEPNEKRRQLMEERYGVFCAANNMELVTSSDIVVLATKPQVLEELNQGIDLLSYQQSAYGFLLDQVRVALLHQVQQFIKSLEFRKGLYMAANTSSFRFLRPKHEMTGHRPVQGSYMFGNVSVA